MKSTHSEMARLLISLANTPDDSLLLFRTEWRVPLVTLDEHLLKLRDELRLLWGGPREYDPELKSEVLIRSFRVDYTERIQEHWPEKTLAQIVLEAWLKPSVTKEPQLIVEWTTESKRIRPNPANLPVVLAHGWARYVRQFRFCRNEKCTHRFFLGARSSQRYCGPECAGSGQKDAKLKHWRSRYGKGIRKMRDLSA